MSGELRAVEMDLAALMPYVRHAATCALEAVRDNPPDDELCTCGLRQTWLTAMRAALAASDNVEPIRLALEAMREAYGNGVLHQQAVTGLAALARRLSGAVTERGEAGTK